MQILGQEIGREVQLGETKFIRLRNGALWIELDFDSEEDHMYVYEVPYPVDLEAMYQVALLEQNK